MKSYNVFQGLHMTSKEFLLFQNLHRASLSSLAVLAFVYSETQYRLEPNKCSKCLGPANYSSASETIPIPCNNSIVFIFQTVATGYVYFSPLNFRTQIIKNKS